GSLFGWRLQRQAPAAIELRLKIAGSFRTPQMTGTGFHVSAEGKEYLFRLYFVDAPEIDAANPARLIEQAKHFGISVPQVIEVGEAAKELRTINWPSRSPWLRAWLMQWVEALSSAFTRSYRRRKAISAKD